ncbi:hypothetical protein pb186bvf_000052 [Paramecium bursaria]
MYICRQMPQWCLSLIPLQNLPQIHQLGIIKLNGFNCEQYTFDPTQLLALKQFSISGIASNIRDEITKLIRATWNKITNNIYKLHPCNILDKFSRFFKMFVPTRNQQIRIQNMVINDRNNITQLIKKNSITIFDKVLQIFFVPVLFTWRIIVKLIEILHIDELIHSSIDLVSQSLLFLVAIYDAIVDGIIRIILFPQKKIISLIHYVYQYIAVLVIFVLLLSLFPLQIYYHLTKKRNVEQEIELSQQHIDEQDPPQDNNDQQPQQQEQQQEQQNARRRSDQQNSDIKNQDQNEEQSPQKEQQVNENSDIQLIQDDQENTDDNQVNDNQTQEQNNEEQYSEKNKENQQKDKNQQNDKQQDQFGQAQNQELTQRIVDLYNKNLDDEFKPFIGEHNDYNKLLEHYDIKNDNENGLKFVNDNLSGFIRVRGDGNCLYTSLIYQYLTYMLSNQERFDVIKNQLKTMTLYCMQEIQDNENVDIIKQDEAQLKQILLNHFQQIYENPNKLKQLLQNYNQEFYGLSIIYFKSLLLSLYQKNEELQAFAAGAEIENDLKVWLTMSNSAEILMKVIADQLKWSVQIYILQSQDDRYQVQSYQNDQNEHDGNFLLLFQPGHYQIPVLKN